MGSFHVPRETSCNLNLQAPSTLYRSRLGAQSDASSIGSTPTPSRPTGVTSTTSEVPAHLDTSSRRLASVQRTSPSGRGQRGGSGRLLGSDRTARRQNLRERGAFDAGDSTSPTLPDLPCDGSPSTSANTNPPADMSLPAAGHQSARKHLRNWRNAHLAAGARRHHPPRDEPPRISRTCGTGRRIFPATKGELGPTRTSNEGRRSLTSTPGSPTWEVHHCHTHSAVISEGSVGRSATASSIDVWVGRSAERGASPPRQWPCRPCVTETG